MTGMKSRHNELAVGIGFATRVETGETAVFTIRAGEPIIVEADNQEKGVTLVTN